MTRILFFLISCSSIRSKRRIVKNSPEETGVLWRQVMVILSCSPSNGYQDRSDVKKKKEKKRSIKYSS